MVDWFEDTFGTKMIYPVTAKHSSLGALHVGL